jgi:uncharacterized membrane protein YgcG
MQRDVQKRARLGAVAHVERQRPAPDPHLQPPRPHPAPAAPPAHRAARGPPAARRSEQRKGPHGSGTATVASASASWKYQASGGSGAGASARAARASSSRSAVACPARRVTRERESKAVESWRRRPRGRPSRDTRAAHRLARARGAVRRTCQLCDLNQDPPGRSWFQAWRGRAAAATARPRSHAPAALKAPVCAQSSAGASSTKLCAAPHATSCAPPPCPAPGPASGHCQARLGTAPDCGGAPRRRGAAPAGAPPRPGARVRAGRARWRPTPAGPAIAPPGVEKRGSPRRCARAQRGRGRGRGRGNGSKGLERGGNGSKGGGVRTHAEPSSRTARVWRAPHATAATRPGRNTWPPPRPPAVGAGGQRARAEHAAGRTGVSLSLSLSLSLARARARALRGRERKRGRASKGRQRSSRSPVPSCSPPPPQPPPRGARTPCTAGRGVGAWPWLLRPTSQSLRARVALHFLARLFTFLRGSSLSCVALHFLALSSTLERGSHGWVSRMGLMEGHGGGRRMAGGP